MQQQAYERSQLMLTTGSAGVDAGSFMTGDC